MIERPISIPERAYLEGIFEKLPSSWRRFRRACENASVMYAAMMLVFVLIWAVFSWLGRLLFNVEYGWHSSISVWIVLCGSVVCLFLSITSTVRWVKRLHDSRPALNADLAAGIVTEEILNFTAAKRFQEPEHGGLIYFLRTTDTRVLVLYDSESQDKGVAGADPLTSSFMPLSQLVIIRAPNSGFVVSQMFRGTTLEVAAPTTLAIPPSDWPEPQSWCDIPWDALEANLGGQ